MIPGYICKMSALFDCANVNLSDSICVLLVFFNFWLISYPANIKADERADDTWLI